MTETQIVGLALLAFGGLQAARPDLVLRFQVWTQEKVFGAEYRPSAFTARVVRSLGAGIAILGFLVLTGAIE